MQKQLLKPVIHQVNQDSVWALPPTPQSISRKLSEGEETDGGVTTCVELISWRGGSSGPGGADSAVIFVDSLLGGSIKRRLLDLRESTNVLRMVMRSV